jgi:hypothetical protein
MERRGMGEWRLAMAEARGDLTFDGISKGKVSKCPFKALGLLKNLPPYPVV